jgi:hypothetical protein
MASVFAQGRYVGAILHRGPKGFEAVSDDGASQGSLPLTEGGGVRPRNDHKPNESAFRAAREGRGSLTGGLTATY